MFPNCHYETWDARWWQPGYKSVLDLQRKCLATRQQACSNKNSTHSQVKCELCNLNLSGPEDFVIHCASSKHHKSLELKFQSTKYDYLFASEIAPKEAPDVKM